MAEREKFLAVVNRELGERDNALKIFHTVGACQHRSLVTPVLHVGQQAYAHLQFATPVSAVLLSCSLIFRIHERSVHVVYLPVLKNNHGSHCMTFQKAQTCFSFKGYTFTQSTTSEQIATWWCSTTCPCPVFFLGMGQNSSMLAPSRLSLQYLNLCAPIMALETLTRTTGPHWTS